MIDVHLKCMLVTALIILTKYSNQKQLPSFIKRCKLTTDNKALAECIKNVITENKDRFMKGVPEMHIPVLDPFMVDKITMSTGNGTAVGVNAVFKNVKIKGSRNAEIIRLEPDLANIQAVMEINIPFLHIEGDYEINGRVMILPINGSGQGSGNFTNVHSTSHFKGKFVTRHGKEYIDWIDEKIHLSIDKAALYFDNLFKENKQLTFTTNKMLNDNFKEIINEFKPLVEETISTITFTIIKQVHRTFSVDELFER